MQTFWVIAHEENVVLEGELTPTPHVTHFEHEFNLLNDAHIVAAALRVAHPTWDVDILVDTPVGNHTIFVSKVAVA